MKISVVNLIDREKMEDTNASLTCSSLSMCSVAISDEDTRKSGIDDGIGNEMSGLQLENKRGTLSESHQQQPEPSKQQQFNCYPTDANFSYDQFNLLMDHINRLSTL